jgi:hypothetical protein
MFKVFTQTLLPGGDLFSVIVRQARDQIRIGNRLFKLLGYLRQVALHRVCMLPGLLFGQFRLALALYIFHHDTV